jgi:hypothetical protein
MNLIKTINEIKFTKYSETTHYQYKIHDYSKLRHFSDC